MPPSPSPPMGARSASSFRCRTGMNGASRTRRRKTSAQPRGGREGIRAGLPSVLTGTEPGRDGKAEAVAAGIVSFEQEFLARIVLPNGRIVLEETEANIELAYLTGPSNRSCRLKGGVLEGIKISVKGGR